MFARVVFILIASFWVTMNALLWRAEYGTRDEAGFRFIGQLFQMDDAAIEAQASALIARFNLEAYVNKPIEGLSHGTRQRVAIASALLHEPDVFVIDEPMAGLDPQHARVVKDILKERSEAGMTVLVSTHQLSVAEEMADRIGIIHGGRFVAVGTRDELRQLSGASSPLEDIFLTLTAGEVDAVETSVVARVPSAWKVF